MKWGYQIAFACAAVLGGACLNAANIDNMFDFKGRKKDNPSAVRQTQAKTRKTSPKIVRSPEDPLDKKVKFYYRNKIFDMTGTNGRRHFSRLEYSFRLVRKIDKNNGLFSVTVYRESIATGGVQAATSVYNMGGRIKDEISRTKREENKYIIITDFDLSNMATDEFFTLKKNQCLWTCGIRDIGAESYRVFTFDRKKAESALQKQGDKDNKR